MKEFIPILKKSKMFDNINETELSHMLSCLDARISEYSKGDYVLRQGDQLNDIVILLKGNLLIQKDDYWGNRSILGHISPGDLFGEAYVSPDSKAVLNDVIATENSTVIYFNVQQILTTCPSSCIFHTKVIQNLFFLISEKNRNLVQKLSHISKRTTRNKLISYLSEESKKHNSPQFTIPFNRQQLADFLSVDRSAMSNELCKMRNEGLIKFYKNKFELFLK